MDTTLHKTKFKCPQKIEVRHSPGKGRGVFATATIRRGEIIEAAPALVVPNTDKQKLESSFLKHYMFQTDDGKHYVVGMGYVAIANHADNPNAEFDASTEIVIIRAIKNIALGKEVTLDYGWDNSDWQEIIGPKTK